MTDIKAQDKHEAVESSACTAHRSMNPDVLHLIPGKTQAVVC